MGVRGELFSTKVSLQNRTYFFNVKENRLGDLYLNIVESKNKDEGGFERQSVILFAEDLQEFLKGFDQSLRILEKSVRDKRRGGKSFGDKPAPRQRSARQGERGDESYDSPPRRSREEPRSFAGRGNRDEAPRGRFQDRPERKFDRSDRPERPDRPFKRSSGRPGAERGTERLGSRSSERGRPRQERDNSSPRKKRVVVKKDYRD